MTCQPSYIGIDVSKRKLDFALRERSTVIQQTVFANSPQGIKQLCAEVVRQPGQVRVLLEPTSRHHQPLLLALADLPGSQVMAADPYRTRKFQETFGKRAKTDRLDARGLAHMAEKLGEDFLPYVPPTDAQRELQFLSRRLTTVVEQRAKLRNRRHSYNKADAACHFVLDSIEHELAFIDQECRELERRMRQLVQADDSEEQLFQLLVKVKGIGVQSALQLLAELRVLAETMGPRQWVACAGLDPRARQSGTANPPQRISRKGNRYLKKVLFMVALSAVQHNAVIKDFYVKLHTRKKSKKLALVAVMRRLLHGLWYVFHHQVPLDPAKCFPSTK